MFNYLRFIIKKIDKVILFSVLQKLYSWVLIFKNSLTKLLYKIILPFIKYTILARKIKRGNGNSINILFFVNGMFTGGAEQVNYLIVKHLKNKNYQFNFITIGKYKHTWHDLFHEITPSIWHFPFMLNSKYYYLFTKKIIKKRNIGLIFISNSYLGYDLCPYLKRDFPIIKIIDLLHGEGGKSDRGGSPKHSLPFDKYIDKRLVVSKYLSRYMYDNYKIPIERFTTIHNGVDVNYYSPHNIEKTYKQLNNIDSSKKIVAFLGRLSSEKRPNIFVDIAVEYIKRHKHTDVIFVIAGDGELFNNIEQQIDKYKIAGNVRLAGNLADVRYLLAESDLLIMTSEMEGIPLVLLEANAMGVPFIAPKVGGIPEIVMDNINGFLINNDEKFVVDAIEKVALLLKENFKKNNAYFIRKTVVENFGIESMIQKYDEIFMGNSIMSN